MFSLIKIFTQRKVVIFAMCLIVGVIIVQPLIVFALTYQELTDAVPQGQVLDSKTYAPVLLTSAGNKSLKLTATPLYYNGSKWVYKIDWTRVRNAQGSIYVSLKSNINNKQLVLSPAAKSGSAQVFLDPETSYRLEFFASPNRKGTVLLRKFFMTMSATDVATEDPVIVDKFKILVNGTSTLRKDSFASIGFAVFSLNPGLERPTTTFDFSITGQVPGMNFGQTPCDTGKQCPQMLAANTYFLYGRPTAVGNYPITVIAKDSKGRTISQLLTVTVFDAVSPIPSITSISPTYGKVGSTVTISGNNFAATGNKVKFQLQGYESGLTEVGSVAATVSGNNLTFVVPASLVTTSACAEGMCAQSFPINPGTYYLSVTNPNGTSNSKEFNISGSLGEQNQIIILGPESLNFRNDSYYNAVFTAQSAPGNFSSGAIYNFTMTGSVPGMVLEDIWCDRIALKDMCPKMPSQPNVVYLHGRPSLAGSFPITIMATDQSGNKGSANFVVSVIGVSPPPPISNNTLKDLGKNRGIYIGSAVGAGSLSSDSEYSSVLKREFNLLIPENEMKMDTIQPTRGTFNFAPADAIIQFAKDNNMKAQGGPLVWAQQLPTWVTQGNFTPEQLKDILKTHITTVITHFNQKFPGVVIQWEVANENIYSPGPWVAIGSDYLKQAFVWAKDADTASNTSGTPAKMFYNDYANIPSVYALVSGLKQQGAPVDAVGLQAHFNIMDYRSDLKTYLPMFAALGLEVYITELDYGITSQSAERLQAQADVYSDVTKACVAVSACKAIVTWGFTDKYSWIPFYFSGYNYALPFDSNYQPKPAYTALQNALK